MSAVQAREGESHWRFSGVEQYDVTLLHIQPQPHFSRAFELAGVHERTTRTYRIGYWYWETDTAPEDWSGAAEKVDELWAATTFVSNSLKRFNVPVYTMPIGIKLPNFARHQRSYFGIPERPFVFLFIWHMKSIMERKNPRG